MTDEELFALVKRVDPQAVRLPPGIKAIAAEIEKATKPEGSRKVFICRNCEGVYADQQVSQCDCLGDETYDEGYIVMLPAGEPK